MFRGGSVTLPVGAFVAISSLLGGSGGDAGAAAGHQAHAARSGVRAHFKPIGGPHPAAPLSGSGNRRFYLDSRRGDNANDGRRPGRAWRSLSRLGSADLRPGDTVAFRRGARFSGSARVAASGTYRRPITLTAYGAGASPVLTNPGRPNMLDVTGDHVEITNLRFARGASFGRTARLHGPKYGRTGAVAIATGA